MKKSTMVTLVLSSTLVIGCDDSGAPGNWSTQGDNNIVTNNTYVAGQGYYHAPYHRWFEYPYNYFRPGFGYYHGGSYTPMPYSSDIMASRPLALVHPSPSEFGASFRSVLRNGFGLKARVGG